MKQFNKKKIEKKGEEKGQIAITTHQNQRLLAAKYGHFTPFISYCHTFIAKGASSSM